MVDADGIHIGDQGKAQALMQKNGGALTRLFLAASRLSGLGQRRGRGGGRRPKSDPERRHWLRLTRRSGHISPREVQRRMTSREFTESLAFEHLEPDPAAVTMRLVGQLVTLMRERLPRHEGQAAALHAR